MQRAPETWCWRRFRSRRTGAWARRWSRRRLGTAMVQLGLQAERLAEPDRAFGGRIPTLRGVVRRVQVTLHAHVGAAIGKGQQAAHRRVGAPLAVRVHPILWY